MFTGLVTSYGILRDKMPQVSGMRLVFDADFEDLVLGESIAVNGVCLTLVTDDRDALIFDISPETEALTNLGALAIGDKVHLERALRVNDRLGGHYVSGHVDTTANIASITPVGDCLRVVVSGFTKDEMRYLCVKGSVALDGVSLTINALNASSIEVMLIPHTLLKTNLSTWTVGSRVNVEFDYIARLLVHQLALGSFKDSTILSLFERPDAGKEVLV
jgi:riboflavin synthase